MNRDEAKAKVVQKLERFMRDLAYTAPELQVEKWVQFTNTMTRLVDEIYDERDKLTQGRIDDSIKQEMRRAHLDGP